MKHLLNISSIESQKTEDFFIIIFEQVNFEICLVGNLSLYCESGSLIFFYKSNFIETQYFKDGFEKKVVLKILQKSSTEQFFLQSFRQKDWNYNENELCQKGYLKI